MCLYSKPDTTFSLSKQIKALEVIRKHCITVGYGLLMRFVDNMKTCSASTLESVYLLQGPTVQNSFQNHIKLCSLTDTSHLNMQLFVVRSMHYSLRNLQKCGVKNALSRNVKESAKKKSWPLPSSRSVLCCRPLTVY